MQQWEAPVAKELLHPHAAGDIYVPYLKGGLPGFTQGRGGEPPRTHLHGFIPGLNSVSAPVNTQKLKKFNP